MSGTAAAALTGKYFYLEYSEGLSINVEPPPWQANPDAYIAVYFESKARPLEALLQRAALGLEQYFAELVARCAVPIVEYAGKREWVSGVIIEDTDESARDPQDEKHGKNWLAHTHKAALVRTLIDLHELDGHFAELTVAIDAPMRRSQLDQLAEAVKRLLLDAAQAET